jgi:site-specific DNA-cytosine methylase
MSGGDGIVVLSLFDGMSCGQIALERAGVKVAKYYASEIDKHAIAVTQDNYPDTIQLGSVEGYADWDLPKIDLLIGGSPCQSISKLGDGSGLEGKSSLFFKWVECRDMLQPKHWLLENVKGTNATVGVMSQLLGEHPVEIDSSLVSAQRRKRLYWTNMPFTYPEDRGILLNDILEPGVPELSIISEARSRWLKGPSGTRSLAKGYSYIDPIKAATLTARGDASWTCNYVTRGGTITRLTPTECERLQTVPDGYTSCASTPQRFKMLGNGWTVDVVAPILKGVLL